MEESFWGYISFPIKSSLLLGCADQVELQGSKGCTTTITLGPKEKNSFKAHDMVYVLWDLGGGKRCKPWWEFLDQFKHKPS